MAHTTCSLSTNTQNATAQRAPGRTLGDEESTVYQVLKRGELDLREVELSSAQSVEVTVRWNRAVLHVAHVSARDGFALTTAESKRAPASAVVAGGFLAGASCVAAAAATGAVAAGAAGAVLAVAGVSAGIVLEQKNTKASGSNAKFVVDPGALGVRDGASQPLVRFDEASRTVRFIVPAGARGRVEYEAQSAREFTEFLAEGRMPESAVMPGARELVVEAGARYVLEAGALTVQARLVNAPRPVVARGVRDASLVRTGLAAFALVASAVTASMVAASDDAMLLSAESDDARIDALRAMVARSEARAPEQTPTEQNAPEAATAQSNQGSGRRAHGESGRVGDRAAPARDARLAVRHTSDGPMTLSRAQAREQLRDRGIFNALPGGFAGGNAGIVDPFGALVENGADGESANGHFSGATIGAADGFNGLGPTGTGVGGGGDGVGTIGQGDFGTVGRGNGREGDGDYGVSAGNRLTRRRSHGPELRPGRLEPVAGMSAESIRRVVLRNIGQVRHCHEQGLSQNPDLAGRVVVRFVIGGDGQVLGSGVSESNVSVPTVGTCIAAAVRRWSFPSPEGNGAVTVNYPFMLDAASE